MSVACSYSWALFVGGCLVAASCAALSLAGEPDQQILVIAHRGAHANAPENSLAAIRAAAKLGCDYVEIDVRATRDGQLVLMHDRTVERTTNGSGSVSDMTLAEIRSLSLGEEWPEERAPTLDEALTACQGQIKVYIDHKSAPPEEVLAAVARHDMLDDVVVYGSVETLRKYRELNAELRIMPSHPGTSEEMKRLIADLKPQMLDGNIVDWTRAQAEAAHAEGVQLWVDYPDDQISESGITKAVELGVTAIQTDQPERLLKLLETRQLRAVRP